MTEVKKLKFEYSGSKPLFQQVADQITEGILNGSYKELEQIPSTTEISKGYQINPATVLKGMNLLVDQELIETVSNRLIEIKSDGTYKDKRLSYQEYIEKFGLGD